MFSLLQASRFFAALIVVLDHATVTFGEPRYYDYSPLNGLFGSGRYGVDFFFVLSGFIICYAHWDDITPGATDAPKRLARFTKRRFIRIYPTYWVVLLLTLIPLYFTATRFDNAIESPWYLLNVVTLFQGNGNLLTSAWTLTHEVAFYVLFGLVIWRRNVGLTCLTVWFGLSCLSFLLPFPSRTLAHPEHLGFLVGMIGSYLVRTVRIPLPKTLFAIGLAGFAICCVLTGYFHIAGDINAIVDDPRSRGPLLPLLFSSFLMILGLVEMERSGGIKASPAMRFLGDASYSLYLLHFPALVLLVKLSHRLQLERLIPLAAIFFFSATISILVSLLFHKLVENPLLSYFNGLFGMSRRQDAAAEPRALPEPIGSGVVL